MGLRLREATELDIPTIGRICGTAFHPSTDSITRRLFPAHLQPKDIPDGEAAHLWRTARKASSLQSSRTAMMVAVDDGLDGEIVGFSLWEIPASSNTPPSKQVNSEPPVGLDQEAYQEMRDIVAKDATDTCGEAGTQNIWHLDYVAVDPQHYRRGIGKLLLDWGVERAVKEGKDCYLVATPAGRPLYLAAGFADVREVLIFGVPHYSMILRNGTEQT